MKFLYLFAYEALEFAAKSAKEIYCFLSISESEKNSVLALCKKSGSNCHFYEPDFVDVQYDENIQLFKFDVPVFCISEAVPDCDGYDVFLKLADTFQSMGKKVLAISENCYNKFFGYSTIDFDANISLRYQAFRINAIIYELIQLQQPDVVLILLPRPMLQFDAKNPFDCGVTAFAISQAVSFDGCVFCIQSGAPTGSFWENISNLMQMRFTCPILAVHVSNRIIDMTTDLNLPSVRLPYNMISEEVKNLNRYSDIEFYQLLEKQALDKIVSDISQEHFNLPYGVI